MEAKDSKLQKVIGKLRKLQRLYEGAKAIGSEEEANAAAAAMSRLLTEYNLTMDEVGTDEEKKSDVVGEDQVSGFTYKSIGGNWEMELYKVLCKWNFCKCFFYGSYKKLVIIGKKENVETVKWLKDMLAERYVEFSKKRFKEFQLTDEYVYRPISKDKYQRSYLLGCASGLNAKLKEESDLAKKDIDYSGKVTALIVRNSEAVDLFIKEKYKRIGYVKGRKQNYDSARASGYEDGKNTSLHKPLTEGVQKQVSKVKLLG